MISFSFNPWKVVGNCPEDYRLTVTVLLLTTLLSGCIAKLAEATIEPETFISPQTGVLVIGKGDTLVCDGKTYFPLTAMGGCETDKFSGRINSPLALPSLTDTSLASAFESLDASECEHTFQCKFWLNGIAPGTYSIGIEYAQLRLLVLTDSAFGIEVSPSNVRQARGTTLPYSVHVTRPSGFSDPIRLALEDHPGFHGVFSSPSIADTWTMQLSIDDTLLPRTYSLHVLGSGGGFTGTGFFVVDVVLQSYFLGVFPKYLTISPGQHAMTTVRVAGTSLPADIATGDPPDGTTLNLSAPSTNDSSILTVSASLQFQPGVYTVPITATFSDGHKSSDTLRITNPGTQWRTVLSQTGVALSALAFQYIPGGNGMAVGQTAAARSTDGGNSWAFVNPPTSPVSDVAVLGPLNACAVGGSGKILQTLDGGLSWVERNSGLPSASFLAVAFNPSNPAVGVAVGRNGVITRTTNGGTDWTVVSTGGATSPHFYSVSLYGANGAIVGASTGGFKGRILRTTDAGLSWMQLPVETEGPLNGVSLVSENVGMTVGNFGFVLRTDNGGATWDTLASGTFPILQDVAMRTPMNATAVGSTGTIIETTDGGQSWVTQTVPPEARSENLYRVVVFPDNSAVCLGLVGGSLILRRSSGL